MSDLVCSYCNSNNESSSIFCLYCGLLLLEGFESKNIKSQEEEIEEDEELSIFEAVVIYGGMIVSFFIAYWLIGFKLIYNDDLVAYFILFTLNLSLLLVGFIIIFCLYLFLYAVVSVFCEQIYEKYFSKVSNQNGS